MRRAFARTLVKTTDQVFTFATADGGFAEFVRTRIVPVVAPIAYSMGAVREFMFRIVSQTQISYRDCAFNAGKAGQISGGDRLPWVRSGTEDNFTSLAEPEWQVHVYGTPGDAITSWCATRRLPLRIFACTQAHHRAGFARDAAYLVRPDSYVACAAAPGDAPALQGFLEERALLSA